MSRHELEIALDKTQGFDNPDWHAEQYATPVDITANLLWHLHISDVLDDASVLDLGCGTGRLGLGTLLLGARHATLVDIDGAALTKAESNAEELSIPSDRYTTVMNSAEHYKPRSTFDLTVMNPPFGTQEHGADTAFLEKAATTSNLVLSLHKASTQQYLLRWVLGNGYDMLDQHRISFPLQNTMHHHDRDVKHVDVVAILFTT